MDVVLPQHQCQMCGYVAKNSNFLKVHLRVHTGVRPYKCNECSMAFTQKNNLTRHMIIHGPRFLFKCPFPACKYRTSRRDLIKPHMMCHEIINFQCRMCSNQALFFQEGDLRKHMAKVHLNLSREQQDGLVALSRLSDVEKAMYRNSSTVDSVETTPVRVGPGRKCKPLSSFDECEELQSDARFFQENPEYEDSKYDKTGQLSSASAAENCVDLDDYGDDYNDDDNDVICEGFEKDLNDGIRNGDVCEEDDQVNVFKRETNTNEYALNGHYEEVEELSMAKAGWKKPLGEPSKKYPTECSTTSSVPNRLHDQLNHCDSQSSQIGASSVRQRKYARQRESPSSFSAEIEYRQSVVKTEMLDDSERSERTPAVSLTTFHHCQACDIYFGDVVMHALHAGCHGRRNPFECNTCGIVTKNRYEFASHLARGDHCRRVNTPGYL